MNDQIAENVKLAENAKQNYLEALEKRLARLPEEERAETMEHFTEYLGDMQITDEKEIINKLGTPKEAARDILSAFLNEEIKSADPEAKKSRVGFWATILLAIFAAPIAVPLIFAIVITGVSLVISAFAVAGSFIAVGVKLLLKGIVSFSTSISGGLTIFSGALLIIGLSLLLLTLSFYAVKFIAAATVKVSNTVAKRRRSVSSGKGDVRSKINMHEAGTRKRELPQQSNTDKEDE